MQISTDVLYGLLSERYKLNRFGRGIRAKDLALPVFYEAGTEAERGRIYVARTGDLPNKPPEDCLIICCGSKPPKVWNMWPCEIFYVMDIRDDVLGIFNATQRILDGLLSWQSSMQRMATAGGPIPEMLEESIPIFNNRVTITDFNLRVLAHCRIDEESGEIVMSDRYEQVPIEKSARFQGSVLGNMRQREPFFFAEEGRSDNYCINLYLGDSYVGTCALQEDLAPLRPCDLELFQLFADYVRQALGRQASTSGGQLITAKTMFDQLLHSFPVSRADMDHALSLIELNLGGHDLGDYKWCCVVIQNARRGKDLPESYLCKTVEDILPHATALIFDDSIVAFCLIERDQHRIDEICDPLDAYLADMGFKAGISRTFRDPFHARDFYQQAICAISTGFESDPARSWYLFGDYALDYMLASCIGDFEPQMIVAPELVRLRNLSASGVDYIETLRAYLDNDCNASKTAKAMFLHRSTLVQRLERIREVVDLDLPDRCLYLRMCLHLPDIDWEMLPDGDIEDFG